MSTNRIDRYVGAAVDHLPEALRSDVEKMMRAQIADRVHDQVLSGLAPADAEAAVLRDLERPVDETATTAALISPRAYRGWTLATLWSCATALPIVYVTLVVVYAVRQHNLWITVFRPVGITMTVAMYLLVAVTAVCALADRYGASTDSGA